MNWLFPLFIATLLIIFSYYTRRHKKTFEEYSVASRNQGVFLLFASSVANYIGPGYSMGLATKGFDAGYLPLLMISFYGVGKIIEGVFIAPRIRQKFVGVFTLGEIIAGEQSHNNKNLRVAVGVFSFLLLIGFSSIMSKVGGDIVAATFGIQPIFGIIIVTSIGVIISVFGSIKASMLSDALQVSLFSIFMLIVVYVAYNKSSNFSLFIDSAENLTYNAWQKLDVLKFIDGSATWLLGEFLVPPTIAIILSARNSGVVKKALIFSGFFLILWLFVVLSLGILLFMGFPENEAEQILLTGAKDLLPNYLFGVFGVLITGVIISTQDAIINGASVIFRKDIYESFTASTQNTELNHVRIIGSIVGFFSIVFALYVPDVITALLYLYSLWIPTILVSSLFSIYKERNHNWISAVVSAVTGIGSYLTFSNIDLIFPSVILASIMSFLAYVISDRYLVPKNNFE